jgi:F0F1-type ATP synthase membrane subunit b/b'
VFGLPQDAALVAMRSEVVAEVTKLRNQELEQAQQELRQQLQQQVQSHVTCSSQSPFCSYLCLANAIVWPMLIGAMANNAANISHAHMY